MLIGSPALSSMRSRTEGMSAAQPASPSLPLLSWHVRHNLAPSSSLPYTPHTYYHHDNIVTTILVMQCPATMTDICFITICSIEPIKGMKGTVLKHPSMNAHR